MSDGVGDVDMIVEGIHQEILTITDEQAAEIKKDEGNALYKLKKYREALPLYSKAISLCPNKPAYYTNRAACYMMLTNYLEALEDARKAVNLDPALVKGYIRIVKCGIALGDVTTTEQALNRIREVDPMNTSIGAELTTFEHLKKHIEDANKAYEKKDHRKVVYCMDRCLELSPASTKFKVTKGECLTFLGRYQEAEEIANGILHWDRGNADAIYVKGMCLFYQDNIDKAFVHFQQVLRLAPDHTRAQEIYKRAKQLKVKKEEGNEAFKTGRHREAFNLYTEALKIDPLNIMTNAKLYFNRATVSSRLGKFKEAIEDCTAALRLDENYLKALLRRAKCYSDLHEYEDAVHDYEKVCKLDKSKEYKRLLHDAKIALKRSKRKDYYKILGVDRGATDDEIKKAYRKRALVHHPDRHANATDSEKKEQEKKFKELGEAYGILSDPKKKTRYDSGQDMEDFDGGMSDIDPTHVFHTFFGGGPGAAEFTFQSSDFPFSFQFGS